MAKTPTAKPPGAPTAPPPKLDTHTSQLFVTKTFGKAAPAEEGEPEVIAVHRFLTEPAQVQVGMGVTINLGNYESARIDVRLSVPVYREEINEAYEFVKQYVTKRLEQEVDETKNVVKKNKASPSPF